MTALRQLPDGQRLEAGADALRARPWGLATVEFVESLRPAWWLLRGWLATQVVLLLVQGRAPVFPIDPSPLALLLLSIAVVASAWWGRRTAAGSLAGWSRHWTNSGNVVLATTAPVMLLLVSETSIQFESGGEPIVIYEEPRYEGIFHEDGTEIINLYVYGQDGQLIQGARLYDQDGRPVENVAPWKWHECIDEGGWFAGGPQGNVFPRPAVLYDEVEATCVDSGLEAPFGSSLPGTVAEQDAGESTELDTEDESDPADPAEPEGVSTTAPAGGELDESDTVEDE